MDTHPIVPVMSADDAEKKFLAAVRNLRRYEFPELVELAKKAHIRGTMSAYETLRHFAAEGRYLMRIKECLTTEQWYAWIKSSYWKSQASAYNYISLARHFDRIPATTAMGLREALDFLAHGGPKPITFDDLDEDITDPGTPLRNPKSRPADPVSALRSSLRRAVQKCWEAEEEVGVVGVVQEHIAKLREFVNVVEGDE